MKTAIFIALLFSFAPAYSKSSASKNRIKVEYKKRDEYKKFWLKDAVGFIVTSSPVTAFYDEADKRETMARLKANGFKTEKIIYFTDGEGKDKAAGSESDND